MSEYLGMHSYQASPEEYVSVIGKGVVNEIYLTYHAGYRATKQKEWREGRVEGHPERDLVGGPELGGTLTFDPT